MEITFKLKVLMEYDFHGIYSYQFNPTQSQEKSVSNQLDKPHESFAF